MPLQKQCPTCTDFYIRSTEDALTVIYAVYQGLLPKVQRRLSNDEKWQIRAGHVYIWMERPQKSPIPVTGMLRFTDPFKWSSSRVNGVSIILLLGTQTCETNTMHEGLFCLS